MNRDPEERPSHSEDQGRRADYELFVRIHDQALEIAEGLRDRVTAALSAAGFDDSRLSVDRSRRLPPDREAPRTAVDQDIAPLSALYLALPPALQRAEILDGLAGRYHHELACLWRSVRDPACREGAIRLSNWRRSGTQWICEFMSYDKSVALRSQHNFHGHDTSQWSNPQTGWQGCQGAIVLDETDGCLSTHH